MLLVTLLEVIVMILVMMLLEVVVMLLLLLLVVMLLEVTVVLQLQLLAMFLLLLLRLNISILYKRHALNCFPFSLACSVVHKFIIPRCLAYRLPIWLSLQDGGDMENPRCRTGLMGFHERL